MKLLKHIAVIALVYPLIGFAQTPKIYSYQVPFYNVEIQPGNKIIANYDFNPHQQTLVCSTKSMVFSFIEWKYKNAKYSAILPPGGQLALKDNTYPAGYFADPKGKLTIVNDKAENPKLVVNCEYRLW